ncbi:hypothetical protein Sru01_24640 [Sphaerisporangium rufum]|uniref:Uncharacterized protein n=1 Tax=Sphaerisporangium rufum TaxID=1381558 RepID=A0A919R5H3_9ACTN|nr:hypothetical protein [Sphaerisporangium rufum]GII77482.1 hypothetical protein Sru01_24640 [Sphaerisporangium rufum]
MHLHCYRWTGRGADRARESERRPPHPAFPASPLPPMRTCDWLLKPRTRIDASPATVAEAVAWLTRRYRSAAESFLHPDGEARIGLDLRLHLAEEHLAGGVDVQWGIWLRGGDFITAAVICCSPNRHAPHPCPAAS